MIERAPMRPSRSFLALCALCCLVAVAGCNFDPLSAPVPTYTCTSARSCPNGACIDGVCASSTASGYRLVPEPLVTLRPKGGIAMVRHFR